MLKSQGPLEIHLFTAENPPPQIPPPVPTSVPGGAEEAYKARGKHSAHNPHLALASLTIADFFLFSFRRMGSTRSSSRLG